MKKEREGKRKVQSERGGKRERGEKAKMRREKGEKRGRCEDRLALRQVGLLERASDKAAGEKDRRDAHSEDSVLVKIGNVVVDYTS